MWPHYTLKTYIFSIMVSIKQHLRVFYLYIRSNIQISNYIKPYRFNILKIKVVENLIQNFFWDTAHTLTVTDLFHLQMTYYLHWHHRLQLCHWIKTTLPTQPNTSRYIINRELVSDFPILPKKFEYSFQFANILHCSWVQCPTHFNFKSLQRLHHKIINQ